MNSASSVVTGGVALSATSIAIVLAWAINGCPKPVPADVVLVLASGILAGGHAFYNLVRALLAKKGVTLPPDPEPPASPSAASAALQGVPQ